MIKNVIFDFGNVLFDLDLPSIERNLQQLMGSGFEQAREKLLRNRVFELYETGGMTSAEFLDHIRMSAPEPPAPEVVRDIWNSIFLEMPAHRFTMLQELRQKYKVFLLSNINELHERWIGYTVFTIMKAGTSTVCTFLT